MSHRPPLLRRFALALLALLTTMVAAAPAAQAGPDDWGLPPFKYSTFYIPPDPLPAGEPGTLLRAERINFKTAYTKPPPGTIGYRIMYLSRSATGKPIAVTGSVLWVDHLSPPQGKDDRPLIAYGNEAMGLGDNCAVSRLYQYAHSGEMDLIKPMLRHGYAVTSSDYEGLGTPDTATFGVSQSAGRTLIDSIRAARQLPDMIESVELPKDSKIGIFGYSQGGSAGAAALELMPTYAPEIDVTAAALGGAPIDPYAVSKFVTGGLFNSINLGASIGYDAAYPELDLRSFLNDKGKKLMDDSMDACIESIFPLAFKTISGHIVKNPLDDPRWKQRFKENTLGLNGAPKVPTYYFHAKWDQASPYKTATKLRRDWCKQGAPLRFVELVGLEHVAAGPIWLPEAGKWLSAQLNGRAKPDRGNCGKSIYTIPKLTFKK